MTRENVRETVRRSGLTNNDAEEAVLGAALMDQSVIPAIRALLQPLGGAAAFWREGHGRIWDALCAIVDRGGLVDPMTLSAQLEAAGDLVQAGGKEYVGYLIDAVPTAANAAHHAALVVACAERRRVVETAERVIEAASVAGADAAAVASDAVTQLVRVATARATGRSQGFVRMSDDLPALYEELMAPPPADGITGIPTGWREFDDETGGVRPGELCVFVALPGDGKSVSLINVATANVLGGAACYGRPPQAFGFVSGEMTRAALQKRIISNLAEVSTKRLRKRDYGRGERERVLSVYAALEAAPLYIDESPAPTLEEMFARMRGLKAEHPEIAAIGVDYLQLIDAPDEENRAEQIRYVSKCVKAIGKELGVAMFSAAQFNEPDRSKPGAATKPTINQIQGSSGIRQAADIIVLQHRLNRYTEIVHDLMEMDAAKVRETGVFTFLLQVQFEYQRLMDRNTVHVPYEPRRPEGVLPFPGHDADPNRRASA